MPSLDNPCSRLTTTMVLWKAEQELLGWGKVPPAQPASCPKPPMRQTQRSWPAGFCVCLRTCISASQDHEVFPDRYYQALLSSQTFKGCCFLKPSACERRKHVNEVDESKWKQPERSSSGNQHGVLLEPVFLCLSPCQCWVAYAPKQVAVEPSAFNIHKAMAVAPYPSEVN